MTPESVIAFTNMVLLVAASAVTILLVLSVCIVCTAAGACIWRKKCEKHNECLLLIFYMCVYQNIHHLR